MEEKLIVRMGSRVNVVPVDCITYLENQKRKVIVHTCRGVYEEYGRLTDICETLDGRFYQCHRSYVINFEHVSAMAEGRIVFDDGSSIYLGRNTFARTRRKFEEYLPDKRKSG